MAPNNSAARKKRAHTLDARPPRRKRTKRAEIKFPFFSLPPELRDHVYDEIWKQIPYILIRFQGLVFHVEYRRDQEINDGPTQGLAWDFYYSPKRWLFTCKQMFWEALEQLERHSAWSFYFYERDKKAIMESEQYWGTKSLISPFHGKSLHLVNVGRDRPYLPQTFRADLIRIGTLGEKGAENCLILSNCAERFLRSLSHGIGTKNTLKYIEVNMVVLVCTDIDANTIATVDFIALENLTLGARLDKFRTVFRRVKNSATYTNIAEHKRIFEGEVSSCGKRMLKSEGMESSKLVETVKHGLAWEYVIKKG